MSKITIALCGSIQQNNRERQLPLFAVCLTQIKTDMQDLKIQEKDYIYKSGA